MSIMTYRSILMSGLLLLSASPCVAQTKPAETPAAATFDRVPELAPPGTKVVVTDSHGNPVFGKIRAITAESVTLEVAGGWRGKAYEIKRDEIQTIRRPGDSSATGAIAGSLAGLGVAFGFMLFGNEDANNSWALALIPIGGVAGYFADRASQDRRLLYAKPSGPKVSFEHALAGHMGVRADVGLASPSNHRPAPRVAANIVISLGPNHRRDP